MNTVQATWFYLILAVSLANLPFLRLVGPRRWAPYWLDAAGWLLCFIVWMGASALLESALGRVVHQGWEVWSVSMALFAVLAFPGLVWRHLLAPRRISH